MHVLRSEFNCLNVATTPYGLLPVPSYAIWSTCALAMVPADDITEAYLDDVVIHSTTWDEHPGSGVDSEAKDMSIRDESLQLSRTYRWERRGAT